MLSGSNPREESSAAVWIDVQTDSRHALDDVGRRAGLPLELLTYCLLRHRRPKVLSCGAWLYCAWQVPTYKPPESLAAAQEPSVRLEEIKVCLGPHAIVTAHAQRRPSRLMLAALLPDGAELARVRPSNLLVTLAERVGDAYLSAGADLMIGDETPPAGWLDQHRWARRDAAAIQVLRRHLRTHREAVGELISCGQRWLDSREIDRLSRLATRLTRQER